MNSTDYKENNFRFHTVALKVSWNVYNYQYILLCSTEVRIQVCNKMKVSAFKSFKLNVAYYIHLKGQGMCLLFYGNR